MAQLPLDPTGALAELGQIKLDALDLDGVLGRVAELAEQNIPGAEGVSVTLVRGPDARSAAFTNDLARELDEWQYEHSQGPCLDAATTGNTLSVPDTAAETRWPGWAEHARSVAGSSLSIGLPIQEAVVGALNIYGREPGAFDDEAVTVARTFASYAAVAVSNAHLYDAAATLAQQLQLAMESRAVIEQAKGIIMGERRCGAEQAFGILAKVSQDSNRKLRDVAQALVDRAASA
ncbi:GAF and ANTAR domain-containing protein [Micromonospora sp. NPDC051006]|uniref:GAF and ANTAR domain-containing protein n=1 Tax=Micromonospora sp. NPDC051006 TaxID=3364283 RepID=UPI0037BD67DE